MFKFKPIFLCFLLGAVLSCGQEPLRNLPQEMRDGVLKTGLQHFSNFEDSLVEKLIKVDIVNKNDLIMDFYEGISQSYKIRFRLLNHFNSKYELSLEDNPFSALTDSQWSYDSKEQVGILQWKPSETFTRKKRYEKIALPLSIQVKKLGSPNKGSVFVVNRDFMAIVNKSYTPPKVYRIEMSHDSYVKLDDDSFYRDYKLSDLNLNYYDSLYVGEKKRTQVNDNFIFYTEEIYSAFNPFRGLDLKQKDEIGYGKKFDKFQLTDSFERSISIELASFLREPYYQAVERADTDKLCLAELDQSMCLTHLENLDSVDIFASLYVKHYKIPSHIQSRHLYYRVESPTLCGIYHRISFAFLIDKKSKWELEQDCYLSFDELNSKNIFDTLNLENIPITERTDIYLLKEDNSFEWVDKSEWPVNFYNLPEHVKWQLGGHRPISSNIPVSLIKPNQKFNQFSVSFYIEDQNYSQPPYFVPEEKKYEDVPWSVFVYWNLAGIKSIASTKWKISYYINTSDYINFIDSLKKDEEYTKFYSFPVSLKPISADRAGTAVDLTFYSLPSVKLNYMESFDPDTDLKVDTQIKQDRNLPEWVSSDLSIETQIKQEYVFSADFKKNLLKVLSVSASNQDSLMDILEVETSQPKSNYACQDTQFFKESSCECSEFLERSDDIKESDKKQNKEEPVYIESVCSYKTKLKLSAENIIKDNKFISAYWRYDYSVDTVISLKNILADGRVEKLSGRRLFVDRQYLSEQALANEQEKTFSLHIFFNLKPEINCFSESRSSNKKCQIRYYLDSAPDKTMLSKLNGDERFFSAQGLQAETACLDSSSLERTDCICGQPQFVIEKVNSGHSYSRWQNSFAKISESFLELECSMSKSQKGFIDLALKTNNPYIYFLDPEVEDDIKRTDLKRLNIE